MARVGEHVGPALKARGAQAPLGQCVEVRRPDLAPETAEVRVTDVVTDDQQDVGFALWLSLAKTRQQ